MYLPLPPELPKDAAPADREARQRNEYRLYAFSISIVVIMVGICAMAIVRC